MNTTAVVLYNPPSNRQRKAILPLSLLALGALLEHRVNYVIIDGNLTPDPLSTLEHAIEHLRARVLGVTVMPGLQLAHAVHHCRRLKTRYPHLTIVWGGYFPTQHADVCVRAPYVDYVIRGHADYAFPALIDAILHDDPRDVPGLVYADPRTGRIVAHPMPPVPHPDRLPDFPYHRVPMERYIRRTCLGTRTLSHHSSYGCPFFCNFCAVVNMVNGRWYAQSAERTARVVHRLVHTWGANAIEFFDNNFFVSEDRVAEFAERIAPLEISWWGEARVDTLLRYTESTWKRLQRSGLRMVFIGAESGSSETLRRMNKGGTVTPEQTLELAARMRQYGIIPEFSFILGNPPDPEADTVRTIEFIRRLKSVNPEAEIVMYIYTPVPLSGDLYDTARAQGFRFPETLEEWLTPEWQAFAQRRSRQMPWIRKSLHRRVRNFERVLHAYYPTVTDVRLRGLRRWVLRLLSGWRYRLRIYAFPLELEILHRLMHYQRPETSGF